MKRLLFVTMLTIACAKKEPSLAAAARGKEALQRYGCAACHHIPGVEGAMGMVGPPLDHMAARPTIAGKLPNTADNMIRWLESPQALDPANAMPNLNVTEPDARDMTAYLGTLK